VGYAPLVIIGPVVVAVRQFVAARGTTVQAA